VPNFLRKFWGRSVLLHFGYPTDKQQVRDGPGTTECSYIGTCYEGGSWGLMAEELVKAHFDQEVGLANRGYTDTLLQPVLWVALEDKFAELVVQRQAERLSDGDLKWRKCEHCDGHGVLDVHRAPGFVDGKVR
jgi:hypothetical protein